MNKFYLMQGGNQTGPFTLSQLQSMWRSGSVTSRTLYSEPGFDEWIPLSTIEDELTASLPALARAAPRIQHGDIICPNQNCGYTGRPKRRSRGNAIIGFLLFCFFLIPGILYFIFMSGYRYYCPKCGIQLANDN